MAAIPNAGGARYAPRGVMRALVRLMVLGGLVTAGWLLGSGISHADEDSGQPGAGLIHIANAASTIGGSGDQFGVPSVEPTVKRARVVKKILSGASAPRLSVQPPVKLNILHPVLHPVVDAVGVPKPLVKALVPVAQPLSGPAPHRIAVQSPAQPDRPTATPSKASAVAVPIAAAATRIPAVPVLFPVRHAAPTVALCSPAQHAVDPVPVQPALSDGPVTPIPASPPGSTTSPCMIGGSGGGPTTKNISDVAVREGWTTGNLAQPDGLLSRDTSDLPRSLSVQPSTSPD